jgi:hypothetical protein
MTSERILQRARAAIERVAPSAGCEHRLDLMLYCQRCGAAAEDLAR